MNIPVENQSRSLYLHDLTFNRIIFLPQNWYYEIVDELKDEGENNAYCWIGQPGVNNWRERNPKEWETTDAQGWLNLGYLESLPEVSEVQARQIDPDLFALLDAINSGECK